MFVKQHQSVLRGPQPCTLGLFIILLSLFGEAMAVEAKPLVFREIERGDTRVLTQQGQAFLAEKIRAGAYTVEVVNVSWEEDRRALKKQPTIYETKYDGQRFLFLSAGNYARVYLEFQDEDKKVRTNVIEFPGIDWTEFLHKNKNHLIDTKKFVAAREYILQIGATGMMFRVGINDFLILERKVERGSSQGSVPVNVALKAGPGNRLRVQSRKLSDDGELTLVLYDRNDGERQVFNVRVDDNNHEAQMEFDIPADRPLPPQQSIFDLETWETLP